MDNILSLENNESQDLANFVVYSIIIQRLLNIW